MITKLSDLKRAEVISYDGAKLSPIADIIYDPKSKRVSGFLTTNQGLLTNVTMFPLQEVQKISATTVLTKSKNSEKKIAEYNEQLSKMVQQGNFSLFKKKIISEEATEFGTSTDIFFDSQTGQLVGFEVSENIAKDLKEGKKTMRIKDIVSVGKDAVIVKPDLVEKPQAQSQQPQQESQTQPEPTFMDKAKSKMGELQQKDEEKTEVSNQNENKEKPEEKMKAENKEQQAETQQLKEEKQTKPKKEKEQQQSKPSKDPDPKVIEEAVGKYVTKNILTSNDELLAKQGDIVTNEMLRIAYTRGVLDQMLHNVSLKPVK